MLSVGEGREDMVYGCGGGGENVTGDVSVSYLRIRSSDAGRSHGGGRILARRWRLRRRASQRGRLARCGGRRAGVGPLGKSVNLSRGQRNVAAAIDVHVVGSGGVGHSLPEDSSFPVVGVVLL